MTKITPANQTEAILLFDGESHFIRVYHSTDKDIYRDYLIAYPDLSITINDDDAFFYESEDGRCWIDCSPQTLGKEYPK